MRLGILQDRVSYGDRRKEDEMGKTSGWTFRPEQLSEGKAEGLAGVDQT